MMRLSSEQVERFYAIWFALLRFVNEQRHLLSDFPERGEEGALSTTDELALRNALWADETLLEQFVATNPADLSALDLALVESWRYRKVGSFYIVRALKASTVFLSDHAPHHVYGVLGLLRPIEEVVGLTLPVYTKAVLLPFEGQIIYDGILSSYPISFGPGIRRRLAESARNAEEREGIITSLIPGSLRADEQRILIEDRNTKLLQLFRKHLLKTGLNPQTADQHVGNIETFAQAVLFMQDPPRGLLSMTQADLEAYLLKARTKTTLTSLRRFIRFLAETGRMEVEQSQALRKVLKQA